jgi:hypothetical protein
MKSSVICFVTACISETTRRIRGTSPPSSVSFLLRLPFHRENGGDIFFRYLPLSSKQKQFSGYLLGLLFNPWRWRKFILPKPRVIHELHSIIHQKTALRQSSPIMNRFDQHWNGYHVTGGHSTAEGEHPLPKSKKTWYPIQNTIQHTPPLTASKKKLEHTPLNAENRQVICAHNTVFTHL